MRKSASSFLLCDYAGRITAGNQQLLQLLGLNATAEIRGFRLSDVAGRLNCPELPVWAADFLTEADPVREAVLPLNGQWQRTRLRRLKTGDGEPLLLLEFAAPDEEAQAAPEQDSQAGPPAFPEIGWLAGRLLHDFKNQISGLKLYASYLKKHCSATAGADADEAGETTEIIEKIISGLNLMAEHAVLISRLTQPLTLKTAPASLVSLISQLADETAAQAAARGVGLFTEIQSEQASVNCDAQLLFMALKALTLRAIEVCRAAGRVHLTLRREQDEIQIGIADGSSEPLSETRRAAFFELPANERLSTTVLSLALAEKIIRQHGGRAEVSASPNSGTMVMIRLTAI
jgi:signal transduction histidine kinase